MPVKYSKAPISELALGIYFQRNILIENNLLFYLITTLQKNYPLLYTHPTFPEEDVINGIIQQSTSFERAGFTTYRLTTEDNKFQILLQQDLVSMHWVRQDFEEVGTYPGFNHIFQMFKEVYQLIQEKNEKIGETIKSYYLGYIDRVNLGDDQYSDLSISDVVNIQTPSFKNNGVLYNSNNYISKYSIPSEEINGSILVSINTPTLPIGQIMIVETKIRGFNQKEIEQWFSDAHDIQISVFESIFSSKILHQWV